MSAQYFIKREEASIGCWPKWTAHSNSPFPSPLPTKTLFFLFLLASTQSSTTLASSNGVSLGSSLHYNWRFERRADLPCAPPACRSKRATRSAWCVCQAALVSWQSCKHFPQPPKTRRSQRQQKQSYGTCKLLEQQQQQLLLLLLLLTIQTL